MSREKFTFQLWTDAPVLQNTATFGAAEFVMGERRKVLNIFAWKIQKPTS